MKKTHFSKRAQATLAKRIPPQPKAKVSQTAAGRGWPPRWAVILLCLVFAGGGAWAFAEFVIFNKLPAEIVGKWEVHGGAQDGAVFDFFRGGTMIAHLNNTNGNLFIIKAEASVEGKQLFTTTRQPSTGQVKTSVSHIRELTRNSLVLESEEGEVTRMVRMD
jgi:uncharacterized protein (TIGR03066 family)